MGFFGDVCSKVGKTVGNVIDKGVDLVTGGDDDDKKSKGADKSVFEDTKAKNEKNSDSFEKSAKTSDNEIKKINHIEKAEKKEVPKPATYKVEKWEEDGDDGSIERIAKKAGAETKEEIEKVSKEIKDYNNEQVKKDKEEKKDEDKDYKAKEMGDNNWLYEGQELYIPDDIAKELEKVEPKNTSTSDEQKEATKAKDDKELSEELYKKADDKIKTGEETDFKDGDVEYSYDGTFLTIKGDTNGDGEVNSDDKEIFTDKYAENRSEDNTGGGTLDINKNGEDTKQIIDVEGEKINAEGDVTVIGKGNKVYLESDDEDRKTNANVFVTGNGKGSNLIHAYGENTKVQVEDTEAAYMNVFADDGAEIGVHTNSEHSAAITNKSNGGKINITGVGMKLEGEEDTSDDSNKDSSNSSIGSIVTDTILGNIIPGYSNIKGLYNIFFGDSVSNSNVSEKKDKEKEDETVIKDDNLLYC